MDRILHNTKNTFSFIDHILIVTKGDHKKKMDEAGIRLKAGKCQIAKSETEWLAYILSADGIKLVDKQIGVLTDKLLPNNLKDLRSLIGVINQMIKLIPNLANLCAPPWPLLKKDRE